MTAKRTIKAVIPARKVNMDGHLLDQPLPCPELDYWDPFLLIHHWKGHMEAGHRPREVGVGPHPHRGFSPVTFVYKGDVVHRDSLGNYAEVGPGGTQWMFAGRGITHSERHSKKFLEEGGDLEFIQFWINAPASKKMDQPVYVPVQAGDATQITDAVSTIEVVGGQFEGVTGVVPTYSDQVLLRCSLQMNGNRSLSVPSSFQGILYVLEGVMEVNGELATTKDMVVFESGAGDVHLHARSNTVFIFLAGQPLNEPVVSYGPFVLNYESQIMEALRDSRMGKMGILIEEFN